MAGKEILRPPNPLEFPGITPAGFRYLQQIAAALNERAWSPRGLYSMRTTQSYSGIVTSQSLANDTDASGTRTLPPNFFKPGTVLKFYLCGLYNTDVVPGNATVTIKIGGTTYSTTGSFAFDASIVDGNWRLMGQLTCRTAGVTGTITGQTGWEHDADKLTEVWHHQNMVVTSPVTIDTTQENEFDVEWTATDAGTSMEVTCFTLEHVFE